MKAAIIAAAVLALGAGPARADWQFTKWGMSSAELVEASGGRAVIIPKYKGEVYDIKGPYPVGQVKFDRVRFIFAADKLTQVVLSASAFEEEKIKQALGAAMGPPVAITPGLTNPTRTYRDPAKGNAVELRLLGDCSVTYTPLDQGF